MAKILVIDDDPAIRRLVTRILSGADHQVIEAADGAEGIRRFQSEDPAVVITDIVMPDQEGIQTIKEIRASRPDTVLIAISGGGAGAGSGDLYLNIAKVMGADAVLAKPFRSEELAELVTTLLRRREQSAG